LENSTVYIIKHIGGPILFVWIKWVTVAGLNLMFDLHLIYLPSTQIEHDF
jgi:hypothetical protein